MRRGVTSELGLTILVVVMFGGIALVVGWHQARVLLDWTMYGVLGAMILGAVLVLALRAVEMLRARRMGRPGACPVFPRDA